MKTLILGLLAAATLGAAVPASAEVVVHERPNGVVVVRHFHHHRYMRFDRFHHRRVFHR